MKRSVIDEISGQSRGVVDCHEIHRRKIREALFLLLVFLVDVLDTDNTPTFLHLAQFPSVAPQTVSKRFPCSQITSRVPDLYRSLGTSSGECQGSIRIRRESSCKYFTLIGVSPNNPRSCLSGKCKLTRSRSLDAAMLISLLRPFSPSVSSSVTFQILTNLSIPPVAIHPRICGLMSSAAAAPSCAERVYLGCAAFPEVDSVRESYARIKPFSSDTYRCKCDSNNQHM